MDTPPEPLATGSEEDSLSSVPTQMHNEPAAVPAAQAAAPEPARAPSEKRYWYRLNERFNLYTWGFVLLLIAASAIALITYRANRQPANGAGSISSQKLTKEALQKLANSDTAIGSPNQVLNIQSSAVFAGKVLVRQDLETAGNLQIGGALALRDITAGGTAQFGEAQISRNLSVAGTTSLQGALTARSIQISGAGSFSGPLSAPQITTSSLQLNGDLALTHHITTGGPTPGRSNGNALGSGGTSSVSGSDTAGTLAVNTGGGPAAGCFATITFAAPYKTTPRILVTPIGSAAGGLNYYVNRSGTGFSICVATPAPAGASFAFDYFVLN